MFDDVSFDVLFLFFRAHVALIGPLQLLPTWHRIAPCPSPGSSLHVFLEPGPCCPCASNLNRNGMNYSWLVGGIPTPWKIWDILWYMSQIGSSQLLSQLLGKIKKKTYSKPPALPFGIWLPGTQRTNLGPLGPLGLRAIFSILPPFAGIVFLLLFSLSGLDI